MKWKIFNKKYKCSTNMCETIHKYSCVNKVNKFDVYVSNNTCYISSACLKKIKHTHLYVWNTFSWNKEKCFDAN